MNTSQKIRYQLTTVRKQTSKKGLVKSELEISELSEFSILASYWNWKLGKSEIFSRLLNFKGFVLFEKNREFPRFPSFPFWPLSWIRKLRKLGNSQIPQRKQILWNLCLEKISEFSKFSILVYRLKLKTWKPGKFPTSSNKTHSMKFTSFENISL